MKVKTNQVCQCGVQSRKYTSRSDRQVGLCKSGASSLAILPKLTRLLVLVVEMVARPFPPADVISPSRRGVEIYRRPVSIVVIVRMSWIDVDACYRP